MSRALEKFQNIVGRVHSVFPIPGLRYDRINRICDALQEQVESLCCFARYDGLGVSLLPDRIAQDERGEVTVVGKDVSLTIPVGRIVTRLDADPARSYVAVMSRAQEGKKQHYGKKTYLTVNGPVVLASAQGDFLEDGLRDELLGDLECQQQEHRGRLRFYGKCGEGGFEVRTTKASAQVFNQAIFPLAQRLEMYARVCNADYFGPKGGTCPWPHLQFELTVPTGYDCEPELGRYLERVDFPLTYTTRRSLLTDELEKVTIDILAELR